MGRPKTPKPPDPRMTAGAQTAQNVQTAIANNLMGATNYTDPYGSVRTTISGYHNVRGPDGRVHRVPLMETRRTLSSAQQRQMRDEQRLQNDMTNLARNQVGAVRSSLRRPFRFRNFDGGRDFSYNPGQHMGWAMNLYDTIAGDRPQNEISRREADLINRGFNIGTEGYTDGMTDVRNAQDMARNQFALDSYSQGFNTAQNTHATNYNNRLNEYNMAYQNALTQRNQPLNEIAALTGGQGVALPQPLGNPLSPIQAPDMQGAYNTQYQGQLANAQAVNQHRQSMFGGILGGVGGVLGGIL